MSDLIPNLAQFDQNELSALLQTFLDSVKKKGYIASEDFIQIWLLNIKYGDVIDFLSELTNQLNDQLFLLFVHYIDEHVLLVKENKWKTQLVVFDIQVFDLKNDNITYIEIEPFNIMPIVGFTHILLFIKYEKYFSFSSFFDIKSKQLVIICPNKLLRPQSEQICATIIFNEWKLSPSKVLQGLLQGDNNASESQCLIINLTCEMITNQNLIRDLKQVQQLLDSSSKNKIKWLILKLGQIRLNVSKSVSQTSILVLKNKAHEDQDQSYSKILADITEYRQDDQGSAHKSQRESYQFSNSQISPTPINKMNSYNTQYKSYNFSDSVITQPQERNKNLHISLKDESYASQMPLPNKPQINFKDFTELMDSMKNEILLDMDEDRRTRPRQFIRNKLDNYKGFTEEFSDNQQVINIQLDSLNKLLGDYSNDTKKYQQNQQSQLIHSQLYSQNKTPQESQKDFQQDLQSFYWNDPQQYKRFINMNSTFLHNKLLDQMGLQQEIGNKQNIKMKQSQNQTLFQPTNRNSQSLLSPVVSFNNILSDRMIQLDPNMNPKQQQDLVSTRYNRSITKQDIEDIKQNLIINDRVLGYFIKFLEEKQSAQDQNLKNQGYPNIFFVSTNFFKAVSTDGQGKCDYQEAKSFTKIYVGNGNSIFERFNGIIVPVQVSNMEYVVVHFDFSQKSIRYIQTLKASKNHQSKKNGHLMQNPIVQSLVKFLETEYNEKLTKNLDIFQWSIIDHYKKDFEILDVSESSETNRSCMIAAYVIYRISKNQSLSQEANLQLKNFAQNLIKTFRMIGITQNKKNELNDKFQNFPL